MAKRPAAKRPASKRAAPKPPASRRTPASKPVAEVTPAPASSVLESLTVADLRARARAKGVRGYSGLNKAGLVAALSDGGA